MKIVAFFSILTIGFLFTSFKRSYEFGQIYSLQVQDSIPAKNKLIIAFVTSKIKKKVGTGECWDLASEALAAAKATWDMKYKFGKEINYKKEPVFPGDIIQFEGVILKYKIDGKEYTEKMAHHTAIIYEVKDKTNFTLAHQNNGYSGRKVGLSPLEISTITKGKIKIYRPV